jgi:excisionase family DNA binding protein
LPNQQKGSHRLPNKAHSKGNGAVLHRNDVRVIGALSDSANSGWDSAHLTSGDIARMLQVDLKTIHNWVTQGHISGARTKGRHLRFARSEVVRFMRKYGYIIPQTIGSTPARVLVIRDSKGPWLALLRRSATAIDAADLFTASLVLATEPFEVVVVGLDADTSRVHEFVRAVKSWEPTCSVVLVGLGHKPAARRAFLAAGGDMALATANAAEVKAIVQFVIGATSIEPSTAEVSAER